MAEQLSFKLDSIYHRKRIYVLLLLNQPQVPIHTSNYVNWLLENTLTYNKTIANDHNLDILVGYTTQKTHRKTLESTLPTIRMMSYLGLSFRNPQEQETLMLINGGSWAMISYLGRLNYDYKEKYISYL